MRLNRHITRFFFALALCCFAAAPRSLADTYTNPADFFTAVSALSGTASTQDFESLADGTAVGSLGGITFSSSVAFNMIASTGFSTTSGTNYLGLNDGGDEVFFAGDEWDMAFASPLQALGMFFISSDALFAGDIRLVTPSETAENVAAEHDVLADGGLVYFLGVVSNSPFTSAQVRYGAAVTGPFFVYNVDDITTVTAAAAVPEPSSILVLTCAALVLAWTRLRSSTRNA